MEKLVCKLVHMSGGAFTVDVGAADAMMDAIKTKNEAIACAAVLDPVKRRLVTIRHSLTQEQELYAAMM